MSSGLCAKRINSRRTGTAALFIVISPVTHVVPDIVGAQETFEGKTEREKGRKGRRKGEKKERSNFERAFQNPRKQLGRENALWGGLLLFIF